MRQGTGAKAFHTVSHASYEAIGKEPPAKADDAAATPSPDRTSALSAALVKTRPGTKQGGFDYPPRAA